ncbi:ATP-binding protein [Pseudoalteromonas sp. Z9A5]|uniref:AAA family ATPase n=1 Tax=Pseudoalteromonas sp. Z9A5 TaxID=2686355 RepID=UPI0014076668|nr:ATP-binding protein [Pseudoalteromonas sp. Z9A5]
MIKRFGFKNFASFKDGTEINFSCKENIVDEDNQDINLSKVIGIKGANGSGKTNILKAITFLYCFCVKRMKTRIDTKDGESKIMIPLSSFSDNEDITEFYIEFLLFGTTYYYELDITATGIVREEIKRKSKKEVICITREKNKITNCLKEFDELKSLKLKADQSLISIIDDFEFNSEMIDLKVMRTFFSKALFNVGVDGYQNLEIGDDYFEVSEFYNENNEALDFAKEVISSVDDGIRDIIIEETTDKSTGSKIFYPMFAHKIEDFDFLIGLAHESMGTKALFLTLHKYWLTIKNGGLLILDEFDTHLHAMILPEILELFTNPKINTLNAQLIITAHNTEIIDSLGRYNTVLVNKENNESYSYRLDEVSLLRNDRLISPIYKKGKIGGTPKNIKGLTSRIVEHWSNHD